MITGHSLGRPRVVMLACLFASLAWADKQDIFGDDSVFMIEATPIEKVDTQALPAETRKQVEQLIRKIPAPKMAPIELPPADYSEAMGEIEPNEDPDQATRLGTARAATGQLGSREEDYFAFQTTGDAQLWAIEAVGANLHELVYQSAGGKRTVQRIPQSDAGPLVLSNLLLFPGKHYVWLSSRSGEAADYRLRIVPLGQPDPGAEAEPNNQGSDAHLLEFGQTRSGYLFTPKDEDLYYFSLAQETVITLTAVPPPGMDSALTLSLDGKYGGGHQFVTAEFKSGKGKPTHIRRLPAGLYGVNFHAREGSSGTPYSLRIEVTDPDQLPVDLEPNDKPEWASPMPPSHVLTGTALAPREYDYFLLPELEPGTAITVLADSEVDYGGRKRFGVYPQDNVRAANLVVFAETLGGWSGQIPADSKPGQRYVAWVQAWDEDGYRYQLKFSPKPAADNSGAPDVSIELPDGPLAVAAYLEAGQGVRIPVTVTNSGSEPQRLELQAGSSHPNWPVAQSVEALDLAAGESQTITLGVSVPPDANDLRPVRVNAQLQGAGGTVTRGVDLAAVCGLPAVSPHTAWPLPESLLGGMNVALSEFGGQAVDAERTAAALLDGRTPYSSAWSPYLKNGYVVVDLAGDSPQTVGGVAFHPRTSKSVSERPHDFRVGISTNGTDFEEVLAGQLKALGEEQVFVFEQPVRATHVRFEVDSTQFGETYRTTLGEFKVIAMPDTRALGAERFNLADPALGGYVVWSDPLIPRKPWQLLTDGKPDSGRRRLDVINPNRWVVGFLHDRAARITHLEWQQQETIPGSAMSEIRLAVSDSPIGPWTPVGTWPLDTTPGSTSRFDLPEPTWARFVRFSHSEAENPRAYWHDAETIRIYEQEAGPDYRSILGEWGHYSRKAAFEFFKAGSGPAEAIAEADNNNSRASAQPIKPGQRYAGNVLVDEDQDWYRMDIPEGHNRLLLDLQGDPSLRVKYRLTDSNEEVIELKQIKHPEDGRPALEAEVLPGSYFLYIEEPPRSVMFVWDNSASVKPYTPLIYRTMARFAEGLTPGREEGNLLALGAGRPLMDEWAQHPLELQRTMNDYDRRHGSSDAERGLMVASRALGERDGTRAVVLIADAITGSYNDTADLWSTLADVEPRVFTLELQGNQSNMYHQHLMQSWASAGNGVYDYFGTDEDLEVGFARASCLIRRPAGYTLAVETRFDEPPEPGSLMVILDETAPLNAVEIILDASGSMLQRLDGQRRIAIARNVLTDLVDSTLPEGTLLALRIFGHREADSCRTDLEVPLAPLDKAGLTATIRSTNAMNLARTPIGASLGKVAEDLKGVEGQKIIILITDGEETCDGDPAAAIQALKEAGLDVRVNIVGFAIDDAALKSEFERWATTGGGQYFDAASENELSQSLKQALRPKFQVLDAAGEILAQGTAGETEVELLPGSYSVRLLSSPPLTMEAVKVNSSQLTEVRPGG